MEEENSTSCALSNGSSDCNCAPLCNNTFVKEPSDVFKLSYLAVIGSVYIITASLVAVLGNSLVILTVFKRRNLHQKSYFLVANLAAKDLAFATLSSILVTPASFIGYWYFDHGSCIFFAFTTTWLVYTEFVLLVAIGLDRYIACVYALRYHQIMTSWRLCIGLLFCWLYGLLWALTPLFGFGRYVNVNTFRYCRLDRSLDTTVNAYTITVIFCLFLPATALIIYFYAIIFRTSRQVSVHPAPQAQTGGPTTGGRNKPRKGFRTVSLITGVYFLCWFPVVGLRATRICLSDFDTFDALTTLENVTEFTFTIGNWANPIIYAIYNKHFRQEARLVFTK